MHGHLVILGIEISCDDSAAAVVRAGRAGRSARSSSSVVRGQDALHAAFGGVVPEIAARAHAEVLDLRRGGARRGGAGARATSTASR